MHPDYRIRPARPAELTALADVELAAGRRFEPYDLDPRIWTTATPLALLQLAWGNERLWVAERLAGPPTPRSIVSRLVAFAYADVVDGHGHLHELSVHPEHGRRGIGRALIEVASSWARRCGFDRLTLSTMRDVPFNAPFYLRLGFVELSEHDERCGPGLRAIRLQEVEVGLPVARRTLMERRL